MQETIERCRPVMLIEYSPELYPLFKDFFDKRRYTLLTYDHARDVFFTFDEIKERDFYLRQKVTRNVFCVPLDKFPHLPGVI
jgi:hypothetical protein